MAASNDSQQASQLLEQLSAMSDIAAHGNGPVSTSMPQTGGSRSGWPPRKKTLEEEDEERYGCAWPDIDDKLRFHPNWEIRRDTLYYVRDNARKKDPRVMATLKYMARRDPNVNVKLTAAEILIHVGMQTLPEQIWMLGNEDWFTRKNAIDTLEFAAEPEDDAVMTALSLSMGDVSATVREAAMQSLMALARKRKNSDHHFPPFVQQQLLERLGDVDSRVRKSAADGITEVASRGDRTLVQDLAKKMTSRVSAIRRGASLVLRQLVVKFDEANDRSMRPADPEASPLAQIKMLMLHDDPAVQRAALDAMQAISAPTNSLYTAGDEVVAINKAHHAENERQAHEADDSISATAQSSGHDAIPESSAPSRLQTGISSPLSPASRLLTGATAGSISLAEDKVASDDVFLLQSDSEDEEGEGDAQIEEAQVALRPTPPTNRPVVVPVAFRKELQAAKARAATISEEIGGSIF